MMKKKIIGKKFKGEKKLFFALLFSLPFSLIFAESQKVKDLVPAEFYEELISTGKVFEYRDDGSMNLKLLPETEYSQKVRNGMVEKSSKNYPFTYEGLYFVKKADLLKNGNSNKGELTIDDVARVCRSVSKMQGMTYYSNTKKKVRVLYDKAYMVANEKSNEAIPDQNTGNANGQVSYCLQNDASFGINHYRLSYFQNEKTLLSEFCITDTMGLGPFKAIYPGKMKIYILVVDCDEDLLVYLCTDLDSVKFPGIKKQITDSMTARMDAVYEWFYSQF